MSVPDRTVVNTYDKIHRLLTETATVVGLRVVETTYVYDDANNRTSKIVVTTPDRGTPVTQANAYVYGNSTNGLNSNQLYQWTKPDDSVATYEYDDNGNRASQTTASTLVTYTYDFFNRLTAVVQTSVTNPPAPTLTQLYQYDHRTRRVSRQEQTPTDSSPPLTWISYSGGTSVMEMTVEIVEETVGETVEETTDIAVTVEYIRGSDWGGGVGGILYSARPAGNSSVLSWAHYNGRGDVISRSDGSGARSFAASYEAYGTRTVEAGACLDPQRANTKEESPAGLLNEGMRYRDLATGMFLTRDPAGFVDGPNVYTYVNQNPWTSFDPDGLFMNEIGGWLGGKLGSNAIIDTMARHADRVINSTQNTLTAASFFPVLGKAADIASSVISAADGDYTGAGMMAVGGAAGKLAAKAKGLLNVADAGADASKIVKEGAEQIKKNSDAVVTTARETSEQTLKKVDEVAPAANSATANRVKPRKATVEGVDANQPRNAAGEMVDPNSGQPLKPGEIDLGHKPGQEWKKRKAMNEEKGSTRKEVIEAENDPELYHWEDRSSNRSHQHEEK